MKKNQPDATARLVGPIPFYDNDGNKLLGLDFKTALGHVFVSGDATDYVAASADVVTQAGRYYYVFSQAETNYSSFISVKLTRAGTSGTSTATAANSLTNSGAGMPVNKYKGQTLIDSAAKRWPIASHTATVFTLTGTGTPASGAYTVEAFKDIEWAERTDSTNVDLASLGIQVMNAETVGSPVLTRTVFTIAAASSPSTVDDFYTGMIATITSDTTATKVGASAVVTSYDGATKQLAFAGTGLPVTPSTSTVLALQSGVRFPPDEMVQAFIDGGGSIVEGSYTLGDILRMMASILGGKVQDFQSGTLAFRNLNDTKTRWTVVTDPSGRITITPGDLT